MKKFTITIEKMPKILRHLLAFTSDLIETIVIALVIFLLVYILLVQPHRVSGDSMLPNFENGELILTDKLTFKFGEPKRGNVIVFKAPPDRKKDFIKRIVGTPGETISLVNGRVLINKQFLSENYLSPVTQAASGSFLKEGEDKQIPANSYFVMGDNRSHSFDSREWGFLQKDDIVGRAWVIYWPLTRLSIVPTVSY